MVRLEPHHVAWFASPAELRAWLIEHHGTAGEAWIGMRPKAAGLPTVSWPEIVDEVLCAGWIDSVRMPTDGGSCIRITPRRKGSIWSARNVARVAALRAEGRMLPAGEAAFAVRREDRTAIYLYEREDALDAAAVEAIRAGGGWPFFAAQPMTYRRAATAWIMTAKRPETRAKRQAIVVDASARGERAAELAPPRRKPADDAGSAA
ncbi:MAG TPA: YdeI/OmpD-associated family protein [Candidatus Limnocylindrales bacterium]|nr:YdeI/OmpD-associated family protein [Candidatus Limnocylindrales bacterium]